MCLVRDILLEHLQSLLSGGLRSSEVKPSFFCSVQSHACRFPCVPNAQRCCHHSVPHKTPRSLAGILLWISWPDEQLYLIAICRQTGAQPGTETAGLDVQRYRSPSSTELGKPKLSFCIFCLPSLKKISLQPLQLVCPCVSGSQLLNTLYLVYFHPLQDLKTLGDLAHNVLWNKYLVHLSQQ